MRLSVLVCVIITLSIWNISYSFHRSRSWYRPPSPLSVQSSAPKVSSWNLWKRAPIFHSYELGASLNKIREGTGNSVKVDIPRRDLAQGDVPGTAVDDDEEPTLPITITGPSSLAEDVRAEIAAIIATKKSRSTQRIRDVPVHMLPFILAKLPKYQSEEITLALNEPGREVVISGERETVVRTIGQIKDDVTDWEQSLENISLSIPKRQHRLLLGQGAEELMAKTRCAVIPTPFDEPGDLVTVWGKSDDISVALGAVYEMARSKHSAEVVLPC